MGVKYFIFIISLFTFVLSYSQKGGSVQGHIIDKNTNQPIMFANIVVDGTNIGASSDEQGHYQIDNISVGFVRLTASCVGYKRTTTPMLQIFNNKTVGYNVYMELSVGDLSEVTIMENINEKKIESPLSVQSITLQDIEKSAGSNRDVSKVLQNLPGVLSTAANRNDLIVRGGGPSENVFYLDGVEIPIINHFATQGAGGGAVGIINPDFVREIEFFTSAFAANNGNALSSVMNVIQKDGSMDNPHLKASVGASDLALTLDIPLKRDATLLLSYRRSYLQLLFQALGLPFLPTYNDFQFRHNVKFDQNNELTIIGLGAIDNMTINTGIKNPDESQQYILNYIPIYKQWNYTIGGVYKHFTKSYYDKWILSRNMLSNVSYKHKDNDESKPKLSDYNSIEAENKLRYERVITTLPFELMFGLGVKYSHYTNQSTRSIFVSNNLYEDSYSSILDLFSYQAFGQISDKFLKERLALSFGLRFDGNSYSLSMANPLNQISPRLSASYKLTQKMFLNASLGRYTQQPAYTTLGYKDSLNNYVNRNNDIKYIDVNHLVAGVEYNPSNKMRISLEGFYKQYNNYPISIKDGVSLASKNVDFGTVGDEEILSIGKGESFGAEMLFRISALKGFNVLSTLTYYVSKFTDINGKYVSSSWDNRYIFNVTASKEFKYHWTISARWRLIGGSPYTPIDYDLSSLKPAWDARNQAYLDYSKYNTLRLNNYHQLDIRIDKEFSFKRLSLTFYVDVQNVYNFKQESAPIYTNLDINGNPSIIDASVPVSEQRYNLRTISIASGTILPTIGIIAYF